ncbi:histidinol-phosphate aminotransferase, chloroplastic-like isoform X2 [Chenopodium quinoa]|uniref:histidinol-phosphate aminotransferase, chloroplastic-like isoform X2 n=1 Tax=Chenopodium quinoa TaxID=63459 RepID=UPI000B78FA38|nr:histidinol-phosphate aminotransferase, chloroplastic-like isoform X2 [Chenopodium quinoa]
MGVIDFCTTSSACLIKSRSFGQPSCGFEVNFQRRVISMASTLPVKEVSENGQPKVTGDSFIRPHLRKLSAYQPILPFEVLSTRLGRKPEDIIKLDANENPYGPPPEVSEALGNMKFPYIYPDPESRRLRAALAEDSGLESEYILVGCGADELIDLIMRIINDEDLLKILNLPVLVILDEAYVEFAGLESRMKWVKQYENLIVLRTFSKRAGLAGLRVGYGAFPSSIIEYLWRAKQPYNVSVAAEIAACAALENPTYLENVKEALVQERERLYKLLEEVPFLRPFPSHSNFILCEVTSGMDAKKLKEDLAKMGVMIRHYNNKEMKGYVRVSVGKPEHTEALMKCLKQFF